MIDRATIERIKESADIVDVVSEFVTLKRVGVNYRGLCPFHSDHSPSFYVSPVRGTCHCFTCGEGGDAVGFLMKHEQMGYLDALRWLARRYNIEIVEETLTEEQRKQDSDRENMFLANEWVAKYFKDILHNDVDGRAIGMQYFRSRGFRDDIIEKFQLGFSLSDRQALPRKAYEENRSMEFLVRTGVCYLKGNETPNETNLKNLKPEKLVDRYSGRAIFPWIGVSGKVVGFGGRVLDSRTKGVDQKYVNSPDSPIYHKDHELYGIFQAKRAIQKEKCVYMVEGYTDVISMHQCGLENVVANSGTALSKHQIRLLHRFTEDIVLLYDGDAAGIKAALRGTDMLLEDGMNVKVLLLPDGDDPDSFARKHSAADFKAYIEANQADFIEFKTRVMLQGVTNPRKRSEAINSIIKSVSVISDPIVRASYIKDCSSRLGIAEQVLITTMNNFIREGREQAARDAERQANINNRQADTPAVQPTQTATPQQQSAPTQQPIQDPHQPDDIPPEAFLPPEAFDQPQDFNLQQGSVTSSLPQREGRGGSSNLKTLIDIDTMLIQMVIRYGERIIFDEVETEDGNVIALNVAQYVSYDLGADDLHFTNPLYEQMLSEAVARSESEDFVAEQYFIRHPDYEVSQLACRLAEDEVQLGEKRRKKHDMETLRNQVQHLVLDFRRQYVEHRLVALRTEIGLAANNPTHQLELMAELQKMQKVRNILAKKLGNNIIAR